MMNQNRDAHEPQSTEETPKMHNRVTIEYIEDEETIRVIIHRRDQDPETIFLDADDRAWELTLLDDLSTGEFRINEV